MYALGSADPALSGTRRTGYTARKTRPYQNRSCTNRAERPLALLYRLGELVYSRLTDLGETAKGASHVIGEDSFPVAQSQTSF
jgi:hypothetical protein